MSGIGHGACNDGMSVYRTWGVMMGIGWGVMMGCLVYRT